MGKEDKKGKRHGGAGQGAVYVVGTGPGGLEHLTEKAVRTLKAVDCVVGYTRYVRLLAPLIEGKEVFSTGMTEEVERCEKAMELAQRGRTVAVVSSGDAGLYGMAGLVLQLAAKDKGAAPVRVEVVPGVPAFVAAASLLGAPLMHDFAAISLSDLLTPWELIEKRVEAASAADFVIVLYNPKSRKRVEGLGKALEIIKRLRAGGAPVGIVRNASREDESTVLTTLDGVGEYCDSIDMLTILIIGSSRTKTCGPWMITPRGYRGV